MWSPFRLSGTGPGSRTVLMFIIIRAKLCKYCRLSPWDPFVRWLLPSNLTMGCATEIGALTQSLDSALSFSTCWIRHRTARA